MIKINVMLLVTAAVLSTTACSTVNKQNGENTTSLYKKGVEMTKQMDLQAENTEYIKLFTSSDTMIKTVTDIGNQDYQKPKAVYEIIGLEDSVIELLFKQADVSLDKEIQEIIKGKFGRSITSQINAQNGAEFLAATSMLTGENSFLYNGLDKQKTYLYLYEGKYSSMVTFVPFEDNIVTASANIVMQKSFAEVETAGDVASFFKEAIGLSDLTISIVND